MAKKFNNLSEMIEDLYDVYEDADMNESVLKVEFVKEFIKGLKLDLCGDLKDKHNAQGFLIENKINKRAGPDLI